MIDLTIITTLLSPIIVVACLAIGFVITKTTKAIGGKTEIINNFIPLIVMILGIVFNIWYVGFFTLEVCVAGAISGLASTGLYEAFEQMLKLGEHSPKGQHVLEDNPREE